MSLPQAGVRPRPLRGELEHLGHDGRPDDRLGHQFARLLRMRIVRRVAEKIKTDGRSRHNVCRAEAADVVAHGLEASVAVDKPGSMTVSDYQARGHRRERNEPPGIVPFEME